jgi:hypothetical protein
VVGYNELFILFRCSIVALFTLTFPNYDDQTKSDQVRSLLKEYSSDNRHARAQGISVVDFTDFILTNSEILGFLHKLGLFQ